MSPTIYYRAMEAIKYYPNFEESAGSEGVNWLQEINSRLQEGDIAVDIAKDIYKYRDSLNIPSGTKTAVTDILIAHYGLPTEYTSFFKEIEVQKDLAAAIGLEDFHIDPIQTVAEYTARNWTETLRPYATYVPNSGVRFHGFVNGCIASVVHRKTTELAVAAATEKERILQMSQDEWYAYCQGVMWSQSGRANDIYRELMTVVEAIAAPTKHIDGLTFLHKDKIESALQDIFGPLETTIALDQQTRLASITYADIAMNLQGRATVVLHNILQPKEQST